MRLIFCPKGCQYCNKREGRDLALKCGHQVHLACLIKYLKMGLVIYYRCRVCKLRISDLSPYMDILLDAGMNLTDDYYLNLSGTTVMEGLAKYLLKTEGSLLEKVMERTYLIHGGLNNLFPDSRQIFEYSLVTGDRRILKFLQLNKIRLHWGCTFLNSFYETAWDNDWLELINDLYELNVYPETYKIELDPVMFASKTGNYKVMDRMIVSGVDIMRKNRNFDPFITACYSDEFTDSYEKIQFIDKYWCNSIGIGNRENSFIYSGYLVFKDALAKNETILFRYLLQKGFKLKTESAEFVFMKAIDLNRLEFVKIICENWEIRIKAVHQMKACNSVEIIDYLLRNENVSLDTKIQALESFVEKNRIDLVEIYLKYGILARVYSLRYALRDGHFEMTKLLIDYGLDSGAIKLIANFNFFYVRNESEEKIDEVIEYLLSRGGDINAKDEYGETALSRLCHNDDYLPIIKKFIRFGAQINFEPRKYSGFDCPLLVAAKFGCSKILKLLIENGADTTVVDRNWLARLL